jgi:hypothetical protein
VTRRWQDVWTRYEMLFGQRYGAGEATWDQYQPAYRWAWEMATSGEYHGHAWAAAEPRLKGAWEHGRPGLRWEDVAEGIRDVWDDVAQEAGTLAEGGASARTRRPFV